MRILIYEHRKNDGEYFDISTPELELAAYMFLFLALDSDSYYADLEDLEPLTICEPCQKNLHRLCEPDCICTAESCKNRARQARASNTKEQRWRALYDLAKSGDTNAPVAAMKLLKARSSEGYEYEGLKEATVQDPVAALVKLRAEILAKLKTELKKRCP